MSYCVTPLCDSNIPLGSLGPNWPVEGPPGGGWNLVSKYFWQSWFEAPEGDYDIVTSKWITANAGDFNLQSMINDIQSGFNDAGEGLPMALRIWHRQILDVEFPEQYCLPGNIPVFGGCHDIPIFGGTAVAEVHEWEVQLIYHNPIPFLAVLAICIAAFFITAIIVDGVTHNQFHLSQPIKSAIHDFSPAGEAQAIISVIAVGVGGLLLASILFPQLGSKIGQALGQASGIAATGVRSGAAIRIPAAGGARPRR